MNTYKNTVTNRRTCNLTPHLSPCSDTGEHFESNVITCMILQIMADTLFVRKLVQQLLVNNMQNVTYSTRIGNNGTFSVSYKVEILLRNLNQRPVS